MSTSFSPGMMLTLRARPGDNGVFDWIASVAVQHARRSGRRLFLLLYLSGVAITICLSNDATAIVLTPAVLASVRRARIDPLPFLFACALVANAASFVLPISNPANHVDFHNGMPPRSHWLPLLPPSILRLHRRLTYIVLRLSIAPRSRLEALEPDDQHVTLTSNGKLVLLGLALMIAVLLIASALGKDLGLPTFLAAAVITAVLLLTHPLRVPIPLLKHISWSTLALVAALFILVDAVQSIGALAFTEHALLAAQHLAAPIAALAVGFIVAIANNLINNLPLGLIAANTLALTHTQGLLRDVTLIAVDLGPNLSVTGSLATILWLLALRREGLNVSALDFLKLGAVAMPLALLAALAASLSVNLLFPTH